MQAKLVDANVGCLDATAAIEGGGGSALTAVGRLSRCTYVYNTVSIIYQVSYCHDLVRCHKAGAEKSGIYMVYIIYTRYIYVYRTNLYRCINSSGMYV